MAIHPTPAIPGRVGRVDYARRMRRVVAGAVVVLVLTGLVALVMVGNPWQGPTVVEAWGDHGLHRLDLVVLGCYLVALACCAALVRR